MDGRSESILPAHDEPMPYHRQGVGILAGQT
jgi:hypothetical protein